MGRLDRIGYSDWKKRIDSTIVGGSTGTEILFSLRGALVDMLKSDIHFDRELRAQAKELIREIDYTLKSI